MEKWLDLVLICKLRLPHVTGIIEGAFYFAAAFFRVAGVAYTRCV